jgi:acetoacetate decarboxylase
LADVKVTECWRGPSTTELRPNAQAPIHRLPVLEMLDGFFWQAEFSLVAGEVLLDYLQEDK